MAGNNFSNFNNSVPAAPTGTSPYLNVMFQTDGSGNDSAYYQTTPVKVTETPSGGTLTINASAGNSFRILLAANLTSLTISNPTDGQEITLLWVQNATGGFTVTYPSAIHGGGAPSTGANSVSAQKFTYDLTNTTWYATAAIVTGM